MRMKINSKMRPEFRRFAKQFGTHAAMADFLGCSVDNSMQMKSRGYLSVKFARVAEQRSGGKFKAKLMAMKGEIR